MKSTRTALRLASWNVSLTGARFDPMLVPTRGELWSEALNGKNTKFMRAQRASPPPHPSSGSSERGAGLRDLDHMQKITHDTPIATIPSTIATYIPCHIHNRSYNSPL